MTSPPVPSITVHELPDDARILDVREQVEWDAGHIAGAVHVPMNSVPSRIAYEPELIEPDETIYVVCGMGGRSGLVTGWLGQHGYHAINIAGGMHAWQDAGRPMISETGAPPEVI